MTIRVYDNASGQELGSIDDAQLQFLIDQLVEETSDDQDYYLNQSTLEMLEQRGADARLLEMLRRGMGERDGFEIRWARDSA